MIYRKEIDGLRAIAVLPVIFFHAGFSYFNGGFVGVDIFFVISGYLITSNILNDASKGTFSLAKFYERRIRRIYPALIVVLITTVPFAWLYMFPYQLVDFGQSLLAVLTFSSNFLFWQESGYFLAVAEEKPLLHTWSLSVEEQFYVIYPLLLTLLLKRSRTFTFVFFLILFTFSLALAEYGWRYDMERNFYLITGRIWELLTGAFVAIFLTSNKKISISSRFTRIGELVGLAFIVIAVLFFKKETPTPSLQTLLPVGGTALIILFAKAESPLGRVLSSKALTSIGLLSYSAYLWHQPLFAFLKLTLESPSVFSFGLIIITTFSFAFLSWKFIETPFRNRQKISTKLVFILFALTSATAALAGSYLASNKGHIQRFSAHLHHNIPNPYETSEYRRTKFDELRSKTKFTSPTQPKLAIIGDSFGEDMVNMIVENNAFRNFEVITQMIPARCQIYYGSEDINLFIAPEDKVLCAQDFNGKLEELSKKADVIIFATAWHKWAIERLNDTVKNIPRKKTSEVYIIGKKIFGTIKITDLDSGDIRLKKPLKGKYFSDFLELEADLKRVVRDATYISMHDLACGENARTCMVFTPQGELISEDNHHLTKAGARYIGGLVFSLSELKKYR